MTHYDFDTVIDRSNTNALNTDGFRRYIFHADDDRTFAIPDSDFIRMWVADMEFAVAPEIRQAMTNRIDRKIFGYTGLFSSDYYDALSAWCRDRYGWSFPREELVISPGVVTALHQLIGDLVGEGECALTLTPAYGQFEVACRHNRVELLSSRLVREESGRFVIDWADLEEKASRRETVLLLLCNPHNPTGRVWSREELEGIGQLALKYDLWIISDEIHCDLLRRGKTHIPMGAVLPEEERLITCMSASKTFNLAGLQMSNIIIRDRTERERFTRNLLTANAINPISLAAHQAAYESGGEWLSQLREYLDGNFDLLTEFLKTELPEAVYAPSEATYLAWVDLSAYFPEGSDLPDFFANQAGVLLEGGSSMFVDNADRCVRLNLAMPRAMVREGLDRIAKAVHSLREDG